MGATQSTSLDDEVSLGSRNTCSGGLLLARARIGEVTDAAHVDAAAIDAMLAKLGPSVASSPSATLHYTCRGLQNPDLVALSALVVLQPNGVSDLVSISLGHNEIGDEGAIALARAIASGAPNLKRLHLHENKIGDSGASALAGALRPGEAPNVQALRLDFNRVGDAGVVALARAWQHDEGGKHLRELTLAGNLLTSVGLTALADALHAAPLLRSLALGSAVGGNRIGDDGIKALCRALRNSNGRSLAVDLKGNPITPTAIEELRQTERECPGFKVVVASADTARSTHDGPARVEAQPQLGTWAEDELTA